LAVPPLAPAAQSAWQHLHRLTQPSGRRAVVRELRLALLQWGMSVVLLADRAWRMGDAIARTLARLWVTRRHLLDWTSAAQARRSSRLDLSAYGARMAGGVVLALLIALAVGLRASPVAALA